MFTKSIFQAEVFIDSIESDEEKGTGATEMAKQIAVVFYFLYAFC